MISVYLPDERDFSDNGIKILKPLKAVITKVDNGDYFLELRDELENLQYYQSGNILKTPTPWGKQCFRIKNTVIENKKINCVANHLFFDAENYVIADSYVDGKNCNDALDHLNLACDTITPFTTISDIDSIHNFRCVRKSLAEAISTILERWGGHLVRDNPAGVAGKFCKIEVRQKIGQDRGVVLSYGKNIVNIQANENWDDVTTKIMPVGKDGQLLKVWDDEKKEWVLDNGGWLDSTDKTYKIPYTKVISFEQNEINPDDFKNEAGEPNEKAYKQALISDLRTKGLAYLAENRLPKVNYILSAYLKNVSDVGDIIYVRHPKCLINITTTVIALQFDVISQRITKVEFGNFKNELKNLMSTVDAKITETVEKTTVQKSAKLEKELTDATNYIKGVFGNSYVIYEGDRILVVDKLPKETAKNVIMINNGGIGFSQTGINGPFNSAWTIDGTLNMQNINVINLVCDMVKGGTLKLGSNENQSGVLELYDSADTLICLIDKNGITMKCNDGRKIKLTANDGLVGFDVAGDELYWADEDEFHMAKGVVETEITMANRIRFIPITTDTNSGMGIVALV